MRHIFYSPEGGEGGTVVEDTITISKKELDAMKSTSFSSGLSEGKKRSTSGLIDKAKESGFEFDDFNTVYDEILSLATVGKKAGTYNKEAEKQIAAMKVENQTFKSKYKNRVVDAELSVLANDATNPQQVATLLRSLFNFDIVEEGGREIVKVLNPDGTPVRKDAYTEMSLKEIVGKFFEENPHFVKASAKATTGAGSKTGMAGASDDYSKLVSTPVDQWSPEQKKLLSKGLQEGKLKMVPGQGLTVM